ncbi:hypothetical protein GCM10009819_14390 [Agromyces tropicus]|uniref:Uncharacterized protein n=1 Tax=Agromyces tropicus TaxID=555371 RepID=A0ABN2U946_9MICO
MTLMPRNGAFTGRRARAGASFLAVSVILAATSVSVDLALPGLVATEWRGVVAVASVVLEVVAVWAALPLGALLLLTAGEPPPWRRWLAVGLAVALPVTVWFTGTAHSAFLILLALAAAVGGYALIAFGISEHREDPRSRSRVVTAVAVLAAAEFGVIVLGTLHLLVWNPMAKVPHLALPQLYEALIDRQGVLDGGPVAWALGATLATVAGGIAAIGGARRGVVTPHDTVTGGLLLIHATTFFLWWAGFGLGLTIADAFAVSGGDASPVGSLLALVGAGCLAAAILMQLRTPTGAADDDPPGDDAEGAASGSDDAPAAVTP